MRVKNKCLFLVSFFIIVIALMTVSAQPLMPNQFYGTATFNGAASEGIKVEAYYDGSVIETTFSQTGGFYNLKVNDPDENKESETITFYLNDVNTGQTASFEFGFSTKLDLSATGPSPPSGGGSSSGGGGGGGGSSSGGSKGSKYSAPTNGDTGTIGSTDNINGNEEEGSEIGTEEETIGEKGITGGVIANLFSSPGKIGAVILSLLIIALVIFIFANKKKNKKRTIIKNIKRIKKK